MCFQLESFEGKINLNDYIEKERLTSLVTAMDDRLRVWVDISEENREHCRIYLDFRGKDFKAAKEELFQKWNQLLSLVMLFYGYNSKKFHEEGSYRITREVNYCEKNRQCYQDLVDDVKSKKSDPMWKQWLHSKC